MLIGLGHIARTGKSTAAHILEDEGFTVRSFTEPVRQMSYDSMPMTNRTTRNADRTRPHRPYRKKYSGPHPRGRRLHGPVIHRASPSDVLRLHADDEPDDEEC